MKKISELDLQRGDFLAVPEIHSSFRASVSSSPVESQCLNSCSIFGHIAHLESLAGFNFSSNYNVLATLLDIAREIYNDPSNAPPIVDGHINLIPTGINVATERIADQGILLNRQFQLSEDFLQRLGKISDILSADGVTIDGKKITDPMTVATLFMGISLADAITSNSSGSHAKIKGMIQLIAREVDPHRQTARSNYVDLFGKKPIFKGLLALDFSKSILKFPFTVMKTLWHKYFSQGERPRIQYRGATDDELKKFVIGGLHHGHNIGIHFLRIDEMIDSSSGVAKLNLPLDEMKALDRTDWVASRGHSAVIENYRYTDDGQLIFLVKDSHGADTFDKGYIHMHANYFFGTVIGVYSLVDSPDRR